MDRAKFRELVEFTAQCLTGQHQVARQLRPALPIVWERP